MSLPVSIARLSLPVSPRLYALELAHLYSISDPTSQRLTILKPFPDVEKITALNIINSGCKGVLEPLASPILEFQTLVLAVGITPISDSSFEI